MPPETTNPPHSPQAGWAAIRRFLPYLWPAGETALKTRVVVALLFVLLAKSATFATAYAYKGAIDRMSDSVDPAVMLAAALVVAYAGARFAGVFFDNVHNTIFERVGQDAARRRSEARRVGKECVSMCRYRGSPDH